LNTVETASAVFWVLLFGPPGKGRILQESEFFMKNICILPLLFLDLCLSTFAGAQAGTTLFVTTDMDCNWKLDGQPMDPLKAGDHKVVPVTPGEHLIQAASTDGVATNRIPFNTTKPTKFDVDYGQVKFWVSIELQSQHDRQLKMQQAAPAKEPADAEVALHPTWTDPATGLMWTRKDNGSNVDWNQASEYCSRLQLADYKDWRLPTLEELQGIDDPSVNLEGVYDFGAVHNIHVKGNLKLTGWQWSSAQGDAPGKPWQGAWEFDFVGEKPGNSGFLGFSYNMRALCVRRSGE
jgi:hypothetical protein